MVRRKGRTIPQLKGIYTRRLNNYQENRKILKEQFSIRLKELNIKIKGASKEIRKLDKRASKVHELAKLVYRFTNVPISDTYTRGNEAKIPKYLFYRMGLENGIKGNDLRLLTKRVRDSEPSEYRKAFIRSFDSIPSNKKIWHEFRNYVLLNSKTFK